MAPKAKVQKAQQDQSSEALELKKEQQNFLNTLKYRANQCNSTDAQELLKLHAWGLN